MTTTSILPTMTAAMVFAVPHQATKFCVENFQGVDALLIVSEVYSV
jgi:hypothetical protein